MKKLILTFCVATSLLMITSTLTLAAAQSQSVVVVNNESMPVPTYNVADKQPFQAEVHVVFDPTQGGGSGFIAVPPGKRLVIEFIAAIAGVIDGEVPALFVRTTLQGTSARYYLVPTEIGLSGGARQWAVSQDVRIYADSQTLVEIWVGKTGTEGAFTASISGYLVNM